MPRTSFNGAITAPRTFATATLVRPTGAVPRLRGRLDDGDVQRRPIVEGIALNVTVWSYLDQMRFSLLSCPDNIADLHALATRLQHGLNELVGAAG